MIRCNKISIKARTLFRFRKMKTHENKKRSNKFRMRCKVISSKGKIKLIKRPNNQMRVKKKIGPLKSVTNLGAPQLHPISGRRTMGKLIHPKFRMQILKIL